MCLVVVVFGLCPSRHVLSFFLSFFPRALCVRKNSKTFMYNICLVPTAQGILIGYKSVWGRSLEALKPVRLVVSVHIAVQARCDVRVQFLPKILRRRRFYTDFFLLVFFDLTWIFCFPSSCLLFSAPVPSLRSVSVICSLTH